MPDPRAQDAATKASAHNVASPTTTGVRWRWLAGWLLCALVFLVLDQSTKIWVLHHFNYAERIPVLPFFDLTLVFNTGAAFSFLADGEGGQRWLFTGVAVVATVVILYWLQRHVGQRLMALALSLILAGAVGNAVDRVAHGHVIDFLLFYWHDWYFPAFNVADIAITCGAALLIVDEILRSRRARLS